VPRRAVVLGVVGIGLVAVLGTAWVTVGPSARSPLPTGAVAGAVARPSPSSGPGSTAAPSRLGSAPRSSPEGTTTSTVRVGEQAIVPWRDANGATQAEVIVGVRNEQSEPVRVEGGSSGYDVLDPHGLVVANGFFSYAFPEVVQPGRSSYLVARIGGAFVPPSDLSTLRLRLDVYPLPGGAPGPPPTISDLTWRRAADGGIEVSGTIVNASSAPIVDGAVCVLLRDGSNRILGAVYDPATIGHVQPNGRASFQTAFPGTPPIDPKSIEKAEAIGLDLRG
jgi:hypothetical protein